MRDQPLLKSSHAADQRVMLDRAFSKLGVCSRFEAQRAVHAGRVRVNGVVITQHTHWVTLAHDHIQLDEQLVQAAIAARCLVLHKPAGYVTMRKGNLHRPTVFALLPPEILSPDSHNKLDHLLAITQVRRLEHGIPLSGFNTLPARITREQNFSSTKSSEPWLGLAIREGKNRQVRRMFAAVGCEVRRLIRISLGPLQLGDLPGGNYRALTANEVSALKKACGVKPVTSEQ